MDILEDLRTTTFSNNEAFFKKTACEIEQLRTENAALKEQVAQLKSSAQHEADCVDSAAAEINRQAAENDKLKETIAQQAEAIRLKDAALEKIACIGNGDSHGNSIGNCLAIDALATQPSPEILQARDDRVAEACATQATNWGNSRLDDNGGHALRNCAKAIRSGCWRTMTREEIIAIIQGCHTTDGDLADALLAAEITGKP